MGDVNGLQGSLDGKVNVSDVTDALSSVSYGKVVKREDGGLAIRAGEPEQAYHAATKRYVDGEVGKKADKSHSHSVGDVNGLQGALDGKLDSSAATVVMGSRAFGQIPLRESDSDNIRTSDPIEWYHAANKRYVDDEISEITQREEASGDNWSASRRGNLVTLRFSGLKDGTATGTLPSSMRPSQQTYIPLSDLGGNPGARAAVTTVGAITGTAISSAGYGVATYVV